MYLLQCHRTNTETFESSTASSASVRDPHQTRQADWSLVVRMLKYFRHHGQHNLDLFGAWMMFMSLCCPAIGRKKRKKLRPTSDSIVSSSESFAAHMPDAQRRSSELCGACVGRQSNWCHLSHFEAPPPRTAAVSPHGVRLSGWRVYTDMRISKVEALLLSDFLSSFCLVCHFWMSWWLSKVPHCWSLERNSCFYNYNKSRKSKKVHFGAF